MKAFMRLLIGLVILVVIAGAGGYGAFWWMNRIPPQLKEPNYLTYYKTQDTTPTGKVAVFVSGLIMPERFRLEDFYNLAL
ncbi:MAG: hypothetical protein FJX59_00190 [Alphaproteobacteria bacterium]|nr:hypothetical protein [Alphaproteobacteria bacterium]